MKNPLKSLLTANQRRIHVQLMSIAKRRKLLDYDVIISLADSSWEILDVSGSDVSNSCLAKVAETCKSLRAVDIADATKAHPWASYSLYNTADRWSLLDAGKLYLLLQTRCRKRGLREEDG